MFLASETASSIGPGCESKGNENGNRIFEKLYESESSGAFPWAMWCIIVLKNFFLRPRPNEFRLIEETGYSFPSGHAMASTAFYGLLIYIAHEKIENKILRNTICIMLGLLILLISISRIYVGVHYTSDVIAGTCFSIAYLILITRLIKNQND